MHTENLTLLQHSLLAHKVTLLRDKETKMKEFRELVREIAMLMGYEVTRNLQLEYTEVETPLVKARVQKLSGKKLTIVPIMRAGLEMAVGLENLIPNAKVAHFGAFRDKDTLEPHEYYCKVPEDLDKRDVLVVDPILATGGSAVAAITAMKRHGASSIKFLCIIAAPEGLKKMTTEHHDVKIITCAIDQKLNKHGYVVPGFGDAGDRLYGTK